MQTTNDFTTSSQVSAAEPPTADLVSDLPIVKLLRELISQGGSDLHLKVGQPPIFRVNGKLIRTDSPVLDGETIREMIEELTNNEQQQTLVRQRELDTSYSVSGLARFRVNVFFQNNNSGLVLRVIPINVKGIDEMGLPSVVRNFCTLKRGLVLVTGPTGSGKSTTLAAIIDEINAKQRKHIITIEDPIEFLHRDKMSAINQREIGGDTLSFAAALKHVMRQSPDVVLVGELRDLETISLAMTAAETGHLVFATLHTTDAAQTIDRMIDVFPPDQQAQARVQLANSLAGVVSQTLLPCKNGGRVAAFELLLCHSGVRNLIREGKTHQMNNLIQTGYSVGMRLLDQDLKRLLEEGLVEYDDAIAKSSNPAEFERVASHLAPRVV